MLLITLRLVYTESVDGYINIVADAKCQVVEKSFQMFATGTVTIDCAMHHCFDVASASRHMSCHRDGGRSQGDTRHSMPPVRRQGGFNLDV